MKRLTIPLVLAAVAGLAVSAHAQSDPTAGAPSRRDAAQADPRGPHSSNFNADEAYARSQIEHGGFSSVHGMTRTGNGGWQAVAQNRSNTTVVVALAPNGQVSELH
jgi:hypothetical protein